MKFNDGEEELFFEKCTHGQFWNSTWTGGDVARPRASAKEKLSKKRNQELVNLILDQQSRQRRAPCHCGHCLPEAGRQAPAVRGVHSV